MKTRIQKKIIALVLVLILFSVYTVHSQSQRMKDKFYVGFYSTPYDTQFTGSVFLDNFRLFSVNTMQGYSTKNGESDLTNLQGGFNDSIYNYRNNVISMIEKFNNVMNDRSMLLSREKITRPAYGQRSTYEAEYGRAELVNKIKKPGYGYLNGISSYYSGEQWQGETVSGRYCQTGTHTAQYIVDSLYENLEQVNDVSDNHLTSDRKTMYNDYRWYIKPRMKIDQTFANNPTNWDKNVVRIEVYNFNGDLILEDTIQVLNFLDSNDYYNGSYKEYYYFTSSTYPLSVKATDLTQGATSNAYGRTENLSSSQIDYRVFWLGEVDVWLDYVRVDDEWAHFLFNPQLESQNNPRIYNFTNKINQEVNAFSKGDTSLAYFYMDEYSYNNMPCISEVNRIIKLEDSNTGLISVTCEECTARGLRNVPDKEILKSNL